MTTILDRVLASMQEADEIGGLERDDYVRTMHTIAREASRRARLASGAPTIAIVDEARRAGRTIAVFDTEARAWFDANGARLDDTYQALMRAFACGARSDVSLSGDEVARPRLLLTYRP